MARRAQEKVRGGGDGYGRDGESEALHSARTQRPRALWAGSGCVASQWRVPRWLHPPALLPRFPPLSPPRAQSPPSVPPPARPPPSAAAAPLCRRTCSPAGTRRRRRDGQGSGRAGQRPRGQSLPAARQAKRVPRAACCPISHPHPGIAAPGDRAAARLAPRRGRRDGNLRWELRGLQPSGTLLLQAVLRALHVAAALVPSADTLEPRRGRRGDAGCTHAGAVWSGHGSSPGVPGMRSAL